MTRLTTGGPGKKGSQTPVKYTPASTVVWRQKSIHNEGEGVLQEAEIFLQWEEWLKGIQDSN